MATYTPTATFHSTITVIDDGQGVNAAVTNVAPKQIADNAAYLNTKISPLVSGGSITPTGNLVFTLTAGHTFLVNACFSVEAAADGGKVVMTGPDGCEISNALVVDSTLTVAGNTTLTGGGESIGAFTVIGALSSEGGLVVNGDSTFNGRAIVNDRLVANAGIKLRPVNLGTITTNQTKSVDNGDVFYIPDSTGSSLDFKVLDPTVTTVEDGIAVWVVVHTVNNIVVKNPGGTGLITLTWQSGSPFAVQVMRIAGSWIITDISVKP